MGPVITGLAPWFDEARNITPFRAALHTDLLWYWVTDVTGREAAHYFAVIVFPDTGLILDATNITKPDGPGSPFPYGVPVFPDHT